MVATLEDSITYTFVEKLCCISEINIILYIHYTLVKVKKDCSLQNNPQTEKDSLI